MESLSLNVDGKRLEKQSFWEIKNGVFVVTDLCVLKFFRHPWDVDGAFISAELLFMKH